jgi:hypothetical protein
MWVLWGRSSHEQCVWTLLPASAGFDRGGFLFLARLVLIHLLRSQGLYSLLTMTRLHWTGGGSEGSVGQGGAPQCDMHGLPRDHGCCLCAFPGIHPCTSAWAAQLFAATSSAVQPRPLRN